MQIFNLQWLNSNETAKHFLNEPWWLYVKKMVLLRTCSDHITLMTVTCTKCK